MNIKKSVAKAKDASVFYVSAVALLTSVSAEHAGSKIKEASEKIALSTEIVKYRINTKLKK